MQRHLADPAVAGNGFWPADLAADRCKVLTRFVGVVLSGIIFMFSVYLEPLPQPPFVCALSIKLSIWFVTLGVPMRLRFCKDFPTGMTALLQIMRVRPL